MAVYTVTFYTSSYLGAEIWPEKIDHDDPYRVEWPVNGYMFTLSVNGKETGIRYFHPDSKVVTLKELVDRNNLNDTALIATMKFNEWDKVIYNRWGKRPNEYNELNCVILERNPPSSPTELALKTQKETGPDPQLTLF